MGCSTSTDNARIQHLEQQLQAKEKELSKANSEIKQHNRTIQSLSEALAAKTDNAVFECRHISGQLIAEIRLSIFAMASELFQRVQEALGNEMSGSTIELLREEQRLARDRPLFEQGCAEDIVNISVLIRDKASTGLVAVSLGNQSNGKVTAFVDCEVDGGDWVLLWAYAHQGGTNPDLVGGKLPLDPNTGFSHASLHDLQASLGGKIGSSDIRDVRFYARSSGHNRIIHFKTGNRGIAKIVAGEVGDAAGFNAVRIGEADNWWRKDWTALEGHTAHLPASGNGWWGSMSNFFVYEAGVRTWAIKGSGYRWEVDDHVANRECAGSQANQEGYDGTSRTTLHQVWVRFQNDAIQISDL